MLNEPVTDADRPKSMTETGRRFRGLKRLTWANLLATLVTLGALIPLINSAYGAIVKYTKLQATSDEHGRAIQLLRRDIRSETTERQTDQRDMSALQHEMDGKLDILIRRTK